MTAPAAAPDAGSGARAGDGMRKTLKILHTLSSGGLIGGLAAYMILLIAAPQDTPAAYADLRRTVQAISDYVLIPSLGVALISGLIAMAVHKPYHDKAWVWFKFLLGLPLFQGTLVHVAGQSAHAEKVAQQVVEGASPDKLEAAIAGEWLGLWVIMALCVAQVILGIWRPRTRTRRKPS